MTSMYEAVTNGSDDFPIVHLRDGTGREVKIAPLAGFNAYSFRVPHQGEMIQILIEPPSDEALRAGGFAFGYPLLFPFPNRTPQGNYRFEGRDYQLDVNFKDGHAIHGLVCDRPWKMTESGADEERGAWATAIFDTRDFPEVQRQYPFDCILTAIYTLFDGTLKLSFTAKNVGSGNLPMAFGIHPWFACPLGAAGLRAECELLLPANARWELESSTQLLPTGALLPVEGSNYNFRQARALGSIFLDEVYTDLIVDGDWHCSRLTDRKNHLTLEMKASATSFREFVVYAPLDRNVLCLEPYSSTTNAVNLSEAGFDAGLIVLKPQQNWEATITLTIKTS